MTQGGLQQEEGDKFKSTVKTVSVFLHSALVDSLECGVRGEELRPAIARSMRWPSIARRERGGAQLQNFIGSRLQARTGKPPEQRGGGVRKIWRVLQRDGGAARRRWWWPVASSSKQWLLVA
jgi:hypothetical protein